MRGFSVSVVPLLINQRGMLVGLVCGDKWRCYFIKSRHGVFYPSAIRCLKRAANSLTQ